MAYHIRFSGVSHVGLHRQENQDNFVCNGIVVDKGIISSPIVCGETKVHRGAVFGVFDGMGGAQCGEEASKIAAQNATGICVKNGVIKGLQSYCAKTEKDICTYSAEKRLSHTGTTAAALVFTPGKIGLCNIGDSKIYRISRNKIEQISADHSVLVPSGKRYLTQNFGMSSSSVQLAPYFAQGNYQKDDQYLICSDGLTDMLSAGDMLKILRKKQLDDAVSDLLDAALDRGGKDNITIILCKVLHQLFR